MNGLSFHFAKGVDTFVFIFSLCVAGFEMNPLIELGAEVNASDGLEAERAALRIEVLHRERQCHLAEQAGRQAAAIFGQQKVARHYNAVWLQRLTLAGAVCVCSGR